MRVKELMTRPVVCCSTNSRLNEAAQLMWENDCGVVPVVGDRGRLVGMVTDRDICMAAFTQGRTLDAIPVTVAMSPNVVACHEDDSLEAAEELMRIAQVRRLPVTDGEGEPIGIISMNDLSRHAARLQKNALEREFVQTIAAVGEPRTANDATARIPELPVGPVAQDDERSVETASGSPQRALDR